MDILLAHFSGAHFVAITEQVNESGVCTVGSKVGLVLPSNLCCGNPEWAYFHPQR